MSEARAVPFYCPFCGEEDLRPHERGPEGGPEGGHAQWHCGSCARVFGLRFVGIQIGKPVGAQVGSRVTP